MKGVYNQFVVIIVLREITRPVTTVRLQYSIANSWRTEYEKIINKRRLIFNPAPIFVMTMGRRILLFSLSIKTKSVKNDRRLFNSR